MAQRAAQRSIARIRSPRISRFPRLPRILHAVFVYGVLILASLFILLPVGWMLAAALKPDTAPVFTFTPEWFPTECWHWKTFRTALFQEEFIRYAAKRGFLLVMTVLRSVLSSSLIAFPFARFFIDAENTVISTLTVPPLLCAPLRVRRAAM